MKKNPADFAIICVKDLPPPRKTVDYCFLQPKFSFERPEEINDWMGNIFVKLRPDVYVINDDANGIPRRKKILKEHPHVEMCILKRTAPKKFKKISSSGIIEKIRKAA